MCSINSCWMNTWIGLLPPPLIMGSLAPRSLTYYSIYCTCWSTHLSPPLRHGWLLGMQTWESRHLTLDNVFPLSASKSWEGKERKIDLRGVEGSLWSLCLSYFKHGALLLGSGKDLWVCLGSNTRGPLARNVPCHALTAYGGRQLKTSERRFFLSW